MHTVHKPDGIRARMPQAHQDEGSVPSCNYTPRDSASYHLCWCRREREEASRLKAFKTWVNTYIAINNTLRAPGGVGCGGVNGGRGSIPRSMPAILSGCPYDLSHEVPFFRLQYSVVAPHAHAVQSLRSAHSPQHPLAEATFMCSTKFSPQSSSTPCKYSEA